MTSAEVRLHGKRVGELRFARAADVPTSHLTQDLPAQSTFGQQVREPGRHADPGPPHGFTLLLRLGRYLPGAVSVHSDAEPTNDVGSEEPELAGHPLRHSLAGVQLKFSVSGDRMVLPVSGEGGWWIVKLPDRALRNLPLNEYLTMRWLTTAGLPVPPVHLLPAGDVDGIPDGLAARDEPVYAIRRFDRAPEGPVHVEDFAQVADIEPMFKYSESGASYEALGAIVHQLTGPAGFDDFVGRIAAMIVVGNTDAHLKNWAFIYPDGRRPALAPVYDFHSLSVYSTYRYAPLALNLAGEKVAQSIRHDHFRRLAEHAGADPEHTVGVVTDMVHRLREAWSGELRADTFTQFEALAVEFERRLATLPIAAS